MDDDKRYVRNMYARERWIDKWSMGDSWIERYGLLISIGFFMGFWVMVGITLFSIGSLGLGLAFLMGVAFFLYLISGI